MAQPVSYFIETPAINALTQRCGVFLERLSAQQKMLVVGAIADHMASAHQTHPMQSSIEAIDPDNILGDGLKFLLIKVADESTADELNELMAAIVAQHRDNIHAGAYD
ncbi:hypothetical protein H6F67_18530 [Microcoleus sp. FACHB-1515]|uniref:hypothetical protein n=1 Tax=Cyanophyceae TaxID=3028117 RepID=UPI001688C9E4|nr:hypothetical protein [Microcoleus sp. FACHB-1515]MBD2091843.1 hypothetical protein [Microcoleus sp. FACHB-1515]